MNIFENKVSEFISRERLMEAAGGKVIVALSGGADSVALLAVLTSLGYDCVAAHCNFHLRGDESDRDMRHARAVAEQCGAGWESVHFDVARRMASTGESMEMACRELRYEWFAGLKSRYTAQAVATGHHLEDNIETMMMNLMRGTGLAGVAGIAPRGARRVSPLLEMSKAEILNYLVKKDLTYVTDSSNHSDDITRNRLRHGALRVLERDFPGAMAKISRSLGNLRDDSSMMDSAVNSWRRVYMDGNIIKTKELAEQEPMAANILFHILKPYGFSRSQAEGMLHSGSGKLFRAGCSQVVVNRGYAIVKEAVEAGAWGSVLETIHESNDSFTVEEITAEMFRPTRDNSTIYVDADKIPDGARWEIRPARRGDRMQPFGMRGRSKLLSDIFNDTKVGSEEKMCAMVLTCDDEIVWLIGHRGSELFKVDSGSTRILRLRAK
ncbi:MAG: tRNA lysidine(34) synthetase TilS [Muribaculaceae bacterium]|nr:tRNA lysidine(34) synthetase TilS [Muribaculaceae bacterium]